MQSDERQRFQFQTSILPLKEKLFRLAYRITFDRNEAEDIVQDTFLKVWSKRTSWHSIDSIEAYCITIAKNLAIDRSQKQESKTIELLEETEAASAHDPHSQLTAREQLKLIENLMNQLPEKQRLVMHLRDIEGESYKEIARQLEITEEQVKINLFRARQKIKEMYKNIDNYGI